MSLTDYCVQSDQAEVAVGRVRLSSDGDFLVDCAGRIVQGRRALSCLVGVEPGDTVLVAVLGQQAWVLEVLERVGDARPVIQSPGGLDLDTGDQPLRLRGGRVDVQARQTLHCAAPEWTAHAGQARFSLARLFVASERVEGLIGRIRLAAQVLESRVGRLVQHARQAWRKVDGLDRQQAGKLRQDVRTDWTLHAGDAQVRADDKVRIDGRKIDLG